ncbi:MAG: choice-of-anchor X domain-containing protein, partial [Myxococcaceae bacterium]
MIRHSLLSLVVVSSVAFAVPRVTGSTAELGSWTVPSGPELKDDGVAPDLVAGDGLYAASVSFAAAGQVDYKVAPNGVDFTGALGTNTGTNMRFTLSGAAPFAVVFTYDTRALGTQGWAPSSVSFSDSATATRAWVAVGDFQLAVGDTGNWNQASTVTAAVDDGRQ